LFDNGHKVGELAKEYFKAEVDVTSYKEDGRLDLNKMIKDTENHIKLGTKVIAEASFSFGGFFCSVDILLRNDDGTYNMYEVKSSKQDTKKDKKLGSVKEKYIIDAAYQQYVLKNCGVDVNKVCVVLLAEDYVRNGNFELDKYFVICDVTKHTNARQQMIADKLAEVGNEIILAGEVTVHKIGDGGSDEQEQRHITRPDQTVKHQKQGQDRHAADADEGKSVGPVHSFTPVRS
jgi:hypothetical protein